MSGDIQLGGNLDLLRCHVCHRPCNACQTALTKMNSNIEIGQVSVPPFIKQNVVRLEVARKEQKCRNEMQKRRE